MTLHAALHLAPGTGHVARRADALLYLPERNEALLDAFMNSPEGGELQALASATVAAGFEVPPFAGVSWSPTVRVMAFGSVAVETDQPSMPMLSGAGSRTWVEHSLSVEADALIDAGTGEGTVDTVTDLTAGVALAGGFRLELSVDFEEAVPAAAPAVVPTDTTASIPRPEPAAVDAVPEATDSPPIAAEAAPEAPDTPPVPPPPPVTSDDDPAAALAAIQAAAMGADGRPVHDAGVTSAHVEQAVSPEPDRPDRPEHPEHLEHPEHPEHPEHLDDDVTLPPPAPGELLGDVIKQGGGTEQGRTAEERESLVDAKLCPDGHPNPPVVASCAVCGKFLTPGTTAVTHVPRPSLGHLELDDGTIVELDHELLVGRNPDRDSEPDRAGLRRVKIIGDKVSRSHLEIRYQGWDVLVADCQSTNGTFVVPHPGGQVAALEPGRPQLLEPGAVVYFGSRSFTVVGREAT